MNIIKQALRYLTLKSLSPAYRSRILQASQVLAGDNATITTRHVQRIYRAEIASNPTRKDLNLRKLLPVA